VKSVILTLEQSLLYILPGMTAMTGMTGLVLILSLGLNQAQAASVSETKASSLSEVKTSKNVKKATKNLGARSAKNISTSGAKAKLGTSFHFDASSLNGKFQSAPNSAATVEDDKFLEDLLSPRRHFRDRLSQDMQRN
jgi:hypothetical protein